MIPSNWKFLLALTSAATIASTGFAQTTTGTKTTGMTGAATKAASDEQLVNVNLHGRDLGFKNLNVSKEKARFVISNTGEDNHAFELEGEINGEEFEIATPVLKPGESTVWIVKLPAGEYEAYCPVGQHEEQGMKGTVTFAGGGEQEDAQ